MLSAPACLILPTCWNKYEDIIQNCLDKKESLLQSSFDSLSKRNWRVRDRSLKQSSRANKSHRQTIVTYLDSLRDDQDFGRVADACLRATGDHDLLIRTCIEWSSSIYRYGYFKSYAAARLLRTWNRKGVDLQGPISNFLAECSDVPGLQKRDVYRLIAELIRSHHLSVGKYLQWLIARGTLDSHHGPNPVSIVDLMTSCHMLISTGWPMRCLLAMRAAFAGFAISCSQFEKHVIDCAGSPC